jgi:N-formylglutamate amidohydrolase
LDPGSADHQGGRSFSVLSPPEQTVPVVFASPHSGQDYPREFVAASRLDALTLRRSEDAFIDRLFGAAPGYGAPLLVAHFPRAYVDPNREPYELDPEMFEDALPDYVNSRSPRVAAGLGTIARVVTNGEEIYAAKLSFQEVLNRIESHYFPYHRCLQQLVAKTRERFGVCLLIDCHSMPSIGGPMDSDPGLKRVDFVLGDCFGSSCAPAVTANAERILRRLGHSVRRNQPYAGGYTTRHYGRPRTGIHALQIEVNRSLYMDEDRIVAIDRLLPLQRNIERLVADLVAMDPSALRSG